MDTAPVQREGPIWTDECGELQHFYQTCRGCAHLRVHDFHYFYCRAYGDQSKPDFDPYNGGLKRIWRNIEPLRECAFAPAKPSPSPEPHRPDQTPKAGD